MGILHLVCKQIEILKQYLVDQHFFFIKSNITLDGHKVTKVHFDELIYTTKVKPKIKLKIKLKAKLLLSKRNSF